jgi:HNH endonuclease
MTNIRRRIDFFSKVVIRPGTRCWIWTGAYRARRDPNKPRYGAILINRLPVSAHRVSYEQHKGAIPPGLVVRHSCDNTLCVNPDHLEVGTHRDNVHDCIRRGRRRPVGASRPGEANPAAKLTRDQVLEIRARRESCSKLAAKFGVSKALVYRVVKGLVWRHVA